MSVLGRAVTCAIVAVGCGTTPHSHVLQAPATERPQGSAPIGSATASDTAASPRSDPASGSIMADDFATDEVGCVVTAAEVCLNARDDNCNGLIDEGCGQVSGLVQFVIAWSTADADVDLLVTDPNGELVETGALPESGLVKERDCPGRPGREQGCGGRNTENVYLEANKEVLRGTYKVRVRLERLGEGEAPVVVNFAARLGPKTHQQKFTFDRREQERTLTLQL